MVSKTKFVIDDNKIKELFSKAGISKITKISPLGAGEYNAVFEVKADKSYVLKIAPEKNMPVLTYENEMMKAEVYWYEQIRNNTDIRVPEVYFSDFSKELLPTDYFIMEKLEGKQRNEAGLNRNVITESTASMLAQIHKVKNDKYGYVQNQLFDNWYDALCSMIHNLLDDAKAVGRRSKRGERLFEYAQKYKSVIEKAECTMVNYDLWDPNVICVTDKDNTEFCWIDPERSFWGDKIFDFICMQNPLSSVKAKKESLKIYNSVTDVPVEENRDTEIRYAFAQGLMGLIMEIEKYYRYTPHHFGWWRNIATGAVMYKCAFRVLKNG